MSVLNMLSQPRRLGIDVSHALAAQMSAQVPALVPTAVVSAGLEVGYLSEAVLRRVALGVLSPISQPADYTFETSTEPSGGLFLLSVDRLLLQRAIVQQQR